MKIDVIYMITIEHSFQNCKLNMHVNLLGLIGRLVETLLEGPALSTRLSHEIWNRGFKLPSLICPSLQFWSSYRKHVLKEDVFFLSCMHQKKRNLATYGSYIYKIISQRRYTEARLGTLRYCKEDAIRLGPRCSRQG